MKKSTVILIVAIMEALAAACTKQAEQTTYDKQTTYIENFISAQLKSDEEATLTRKEGAYRINLHDNLSQERDSLRPGGKVALYYGCFILTGASLSTSNLVATNLKELATQAKWTLSEDEDRYMLDTLTLDDSLLPGLRIGLEGVQPQDEGYILFTGKYGYGNSQRGTIPAMSALAYYYWIENIKNE